jgi:DNA-binding protein H-NS
VARPNGIDKLSYAQLLNLQQKIAVAITERKAADAQATREQLRAIAEKSGFSLAELFGGKRGGKRGPAAVKYRNPKDTSQTWTGRGRKPNWLVDAVKKGAKIDSFSV